MIGGGEKATKTKTPEAAETGKAAYTVNGVA